MKAHTPPAMTNSTAPSWVAAIEKFFFEPADPTLLGFIRILVGCVAFYTVITWGIGLMGFVGPDAWVDAKAAHYLTHEVRFWGPPTDWKDPNGRVVGEGYYFASPYFHVTSPAWIWIIHLSILAVTFLYIIGFQTPITSKLAWLGFMSYTQRCSPMLFGMDTMVNILGIYLAIGPSGAALSLDRWLEVHRLRRFGLPVEPAAPQPTARLALRLIQIHFCLIYLASGTAKLQGSSWWNGTALWRCFANFTFAPVGSPWYLALLRFLSEHRLLWEAVMSGGILFTLILEIGLPLLIWVPRFRPLCIICSILLHAGIGLVMSLTTFSMVMMCMVLTFTPPEMIGLWLESVRRYFEASPPARAAEAGLQPKAAALAATR